MFAGTVRSTYPCISCLGWWSLVNPEMRYTLGLGCGVRNQMEVMKTNTRWVVVAMLLIAVVFNSTGPPMASMVLLRFLLPSVFLAVSYGRHETKSLGASKVRMDGSFIYL